MILGLFMVLWPLAGQADLTLTGYSVTGLTNLPLSSPEQVQIQKTLVRRDYVDRGRAYTHLFDLARRQAAIIDHMMRTVEIHDLSGVQSQSEVSAPAEGLKLSIKKTGQANHLKHWKCEEHTLTASMPARLGNEESVFHLAGSVWLANGVKELAELKDLIEQTKKPGFFVGIPAVAKVSPAQSVAISEIIRRLAPRGLVCAGEIQASYEGSGPMANLARRMPSRLGVSFQEFSNNPIQPETFAIPAGYRVLRK